MKSISIRVSGKVQGVYYRASAKAIANQLGIMGFVQNENTGDVYLEVEGSEQSLNEFVEWCKHGPRDAHVSTLTTMEIEPTGFVGFRIVR